MSATFCMADPLFAEHADHRENKSDERAAQAKQPEGAPYGEFPDIVVVHEVPAEVVIPRGGTLTTGHTESGIQK